MRFDEHFLRGVLPDATIISNAFPQDIQVSIDSRTINPGEIFVALPGKVVGGHAYIADAFKRGAAGCIIAHDKQSFLSSDVTLQKNTLIVCVQDTIQALLKLASAWRSEFTIPIIGITGSVGKTTTKHVLANIFQANEMSALISSGNQNTQIGVAINILKLRSTHKVGIFECGISKPGEMGSIVHILRPTTAIITAIGHSHMEGLGSLQDIAHEKRDIFKYFNDTSVGIINGDQPLLSTISYRHPVLKFGSKTSNQIQARKILISSNQATFVLKLYKEKHNVQLKKGHEGLIFNCLAAASAAHYLGIPAQAIIKGIQTPVNVPGRFEECVLKDNKGTLINDAYNASPESMKAALLAFGRIETSASKVVVLGDMLELGVNSPFWHRQIGRFLSKVPSVNKVILVGNMVQWTKKTIPSGMEVEHVPTWKEAVSCLSSILHQPAMVLVKGSNGIGLGNLVEAMIKKTEIT